MSGVELIAFVQAQLDADEQAARAATSGPWVYNPSKAWHSPPPAFGVASPAEEFVRAGSSDSPICLAATGPADNPQSMADARHIAAWDPARVLAEINAKRAILAAELRYLAKIDSEWGCCHDADEIAAGECPELGAFDGDEWDMPIIRALAQPYVDRPGFQPEWKVQA